MPEETVANKKNEFSDAVDQNAEGKETQTIAELYSGYTPEMLATLPPETRLEVENARKEDSDKYPKNNETSSDGSTKTETSGEEPEDRTNQEPEKKPVDDKNKNAETGNEVNWEKLLALHQARYQTLQGKYNAEVPELTRQIQQLRKENEQLKKQHSKNNGEVEETDQKENPERTQRIAKLEEAGFDHEAAVALIEAMSPTEKSSDPRLEQVAQDVNLIRQRNEEDRAARVNSALNSELNKYGLSMAVIGQQRETVEEFMNQFSRVDPNTNKQVYAIEDYMEARDRGDVAVMARILKDITDKMREERVFYSPSTTSHAIPEQIDTNNKFVETARQNTEVRRGAPTLPKSVPGSTTGMPPQRREQSVILSELNAATRKFNMGIGDPSALLRTIDKLNKELSAYGSGGK